MNTPLHVHVVDADRASRDGLVRYFESQGLTATPMESAGELLRRLHRNRPDIVVMDGGLAAPGGPSGLQACRQLRDEGDRVPLILLSARNDEVDRVLALEMGADDVLGKPCPTRELLARIQAVLRRSIVPPGLPMLTMAPVTIGAQQFDMASRCQLRGDHVLLQTATTVNFKAGPFGRLLCAGVDYQIEHHLFPGLGHTHYKRMAPQVEAFCRAHGYPNRVMSWRAAVWKSLRAMATPRPVVRVLGDLRRGGEPTAKP